MNNFGEKVSFIWSVADLLRGPYKPAQYGKVILPLTVIRRLDCVLEPTKERVLAKAKSLKGGRVGNIEPILNRVAKVPFHNMSRLDFQKLQGEPDKIAANLTRYINSFSSKARDIIDNFGFETEIAKLDTSMVYKNREAFLADLAYSVKAVAVKVSAPIKKAILAALSERDESAGVCTDKDGNPEPDPELRDYESVPLKEDIREYFEREVIPHVPDAWIDENKRDKRDDEVGIVGYEIPLTRHFCEYKPPRPLEEIEADIKTIEKDIIQMLGEVTA